MSVPFRATGAVLLLSLLPLALVHAADGAAPKLRNGVLCQKQTVDAYEGETHRCYFSPHKFGKRDFSTRNGRAQYIASELRCDEVEILGDGRSPLTAPDGGELKQVSVHCTE
jgi:hypothetical protein